MSMEFDHSDEYYRTGLKENAFDYLDKTKSFYEKSKENKSYWKWVVIALHGAIYHFMLLALKNTDCSGVFKKEKQCDDGSLDLLELGRMRLIEFLEAFNRIQSEDFMKGYIGAKPYNAEKHIVEAMEGLNKWRNAFIHYGPIGRSIEIALFENVLKNTLPVLRFLINDSGRIYLGEKDWEDANEVVDAFGV